LFNQLAVIFEAFMAGLLILFPFGMVAQDKLKDILLSFDVGYAYEVINQSIANLAFIFHLSYTIGAPAAGYLVAVAAGSAKAIKITFRFLDSSYQLLFGIPPGFF
jgi:hypothetical protein